MPTTRRAHRTTHFRSKMPRAAGLTLFARLGKPNAPLLPPRGKGHECYPVAPLKMSEYHEPQEELDDRVRDLHRALSSLREEIEAVDWYTQRAARAADDQLRRVIEHNRDEEIEHACMTLEWLRRVVPAWDEALRTYLFKTGDIVGIEKVAEGKEAAETGAIAEAGAGPGGTGRGLGVGSLNSRSKE